MARYAAFLRGMNLGRRRISNAELAAAFTAIGLHDVRTFRASGNVAFDAEEPDTERLALQIETGLGEQLGYAVPTFVRTAAEVHAIAAHEPFTQRSGAEGGKLQVGLLASAPSKAAAAEVLAMDADCDRLALGVRELYWLPIGGLSDWDLDLKAIERLLGGITVRTMGTIEQMAERLRAG